MNPRTFLKELSQDVDRDRIVDVVYDEFAGYCRENNITEDEISTPALEQLAEGFVTRGFSFEREGKGRYRSQDFEEAMEELGSATDGSEVDQ